MRCRACHRASRLASGRGTAAPAWSSSNRAARAYLSTITTRRHARSALEPRLTMRARPQGYDVVRGSRQGDLAPSGNLDQGLAGRLSRAELAKTPWEHEPQISVPDSEDYLLPRWDRK